MRVPVARLFGRLVAVVALVQIFASNGVIVIDTPPHADRAAGRSPT